MSTRRGRGRGRGRKRAKIEAPLVVPLAAAVEQEAVVTPHHEARPLVMATPLGLLMKIEAALWLRCKGKGAIFSVAEFYSMTRAHEWLNHSAKYHSVDETKISASAVITKDVSELCDRVCRLMTKMREEDRLLTDFLAVTAFTWDGCPNLYPLYRLHSSSKGKMKLEALQLQQPKASLETSTKEFTRSELLGNMYHQSRRHFRFESTANNASLDNWWKHIKCIAQYVQNHGAFMAASTTKEEERGNTNSFKTLMTNGTAAAAPTKQNITNKMSLEDRVRMRSLRNATAMKSKQSVVGGISDKGSENKTLLELADALRSYSQRRGLGSPGMGSALDRLKNRGSGLAGTFTAKDSARLPVADLIKDARMAWASVVNGSLDRHDDRGSKSRRSGSTPIVARVDLRRVIYQIRLKMVSSQNISDRRQMEAQLMGLLEKLAESVPKWLRVHKAPPVMTGADDSKGITATKTNQASYIRQSIIVIRNDSVDYATDVRSKLGGRVHANVGAVANITGDNGSVTRKGKKRSVNEMAQPLNEKVQGPLAVADSIVPPSFRKMYAKALDIEKNLSPS
ncbi:hypothetical protein ACHAWF_006676 [Thalassiosira exigua]